MDTVIDYVTGNFAYCVEIRTLAVALAGAYAVRSGRNPDGKSLHWFHAFALSTLAGFGGGWFTFAWMGRPTSMIAAADINMTCCIIAFLFMNMIPLDLGYILAKSQPGQIIITSGAQLFRALGTIGFVTFAMENLSPSPYYPIPLLGPIVYGSLLGNMGPLVTKGVDAYLSGGMPWGFQQGKRRFHFKFIIVL
jgi:hypothetical protein